MEPILTGLLASAGKAVLDHVFEPKPKFEGPQLNKGVQFDGLLQKAQGVGSSQKSSSSLSVFLSKNGVRGIEDVRGLRDQLVRELAERSGLGTGNFQLQVEAGQVSLRSQDGQIVDLSQNPVLNDLGLRVHQLNSIEQASGYLANASIKDLADRVGIGATASVSWPVVRSTMIA